MENILFITMVIPKVGTNGWGLNVLNFNFLKTTGVIMRQIIFLFSLFLFSFASSQTTILLEVDGIKGNVTGTKGKDLISAMSFNHGVSMPMTVDRRNQHIPSGTASHQDMTITKYFDAASPALNNKCCLGTEIKSVKVHLWTINPAATPRDVEWATIILEGCFITSVSLGDGGDSPVETLTFSYRQITWDYYPGADGETNVPAGKISFTQKSEVKP
jgi:type VI secretion system secreted protein Hcp